MNDPQGYYRLVTPFPPEKNEFGEEWVGELFYLIEIKGDEVELLQGNQEWAITLDEFKGCFQYAPEGITERSDRMAELMGGIMAAGMHSDHLLASSVTANLLTDQSNTQPLEESNCREIKTTGHNLRKDGDKLAKTVRKNMKRMKTQAARVKSAVGRHQTELATYVAEQRAIMERKSAALIKQVKLAEEVIYIINAYLGADEKIVRLKRGRPADAEVKIVIRQKILYMDEECALDEDLAERGGIDFETIEEFDQWVIQPKNLQQVIPEEKAIVALKPRRKDKHYSDNPFVNADLNRQNKCLYILIRNGNNIWRVYSTLWLSSVLLPRKDEFDEYFVNTRTEYNVEEDDTTFGRRKRRQVKEPHRPGSAKFIEAMEAASAHRRRFQTVLLIIQGLLDRTKIFHPMQSNDIVNICDLAKAQKWIDLRYDAENLLSDGRPRFDEWLRQVNKRMDVGCRIIGKFGSIAYEKNRKYPKHAHAPESNQLHVLEKAFQEGRFAFYYKRDGETVYAGWGDYYGHEAKNRARFEVTNYESVVINFDAAEIDDMKYYINSRLDRHEYLSMIPLLKLTITMKEAEREEESPFRKLLIGEMSKHNGVTIAEAEEKVDELISWWKFRCRTHRALTSDDAKALRMIVPEHGRRLALAAELSMSERVNTVIVKKLTGDRKDILAILQKKEKEYAVYRFHNEENVFVQEETWQWNPATNQLARLRSREWKTVDKRHESWALLSSNSRWEKWNIGAMANEYLTDPEREQAVEFGLNCLKKARQGLRKSESWRNENLHYSVRHFLATWHNVEGKRWLVPLVVACSDKNVHLYFTFAHCTIPKFLLTGRMEAPDMGSVTIGWKKKKKGEIEFDIPDMHRISCTTTSPPWASGYEYHYGTSQQILQRFDDNIQAMRSEEEQITALEKQSREMQRPLDNFTSKLQNKLKADWIEDQRILFLEEYEDEDGSFWEEYKVDLKVPYSDIFPDWFTSAACVVVEEGLDIEGWTVAKVIEEAEKRGFDWDKSDGCHRRTGRRRRDQGRGTGMAHFDAVKDIVVELTAEPELDEEEDG